MAVVVQMARWRECGARDAGSAAGICRQSVQRAARRPEVDGVLEICALALTPASRAALPENATLVFATLLDGVPAEGSIWVVLACRCRTRVARVGIRLERRPTGRESPICASDVHSLLLFFSSSVTLKVKLLMRTTLLRFQIHDLFVIRYIEIQS